MNSMYLGGSKNNNHKLPWFLFNIILGGFVFYVFLGVITYYELYKLYAESENLAISSLNSETMTEDQMFEYSKTQNKLKNKIYAYDGMTRILYPWMVPNKDSMPYDSEDDSIGIMKDEKTGENIKEVL